MLLLPAPVIPTTPTISPPAMEKDREPSVTWVRCVGIAARRIGKRWLHACASLVQGLGAGEADLNGLFFANTEGSQKES